MQTRSGDENSVCPSVSPSVRLSNACIVTKRKKDMFTFFISYERSFSLVFWEEERLVGATPSTWNFGSTGPRWSEIADFEPIIARSASAVTPREKVQLTLIGSQLCAFQWAQDEHHFVVPKPLPQRVAQKRKVSKNWTVSYYKSEIL